VLPLLLLLSLTLAAQPAADPLAAGQDALQRGDLSAAEQSFRLYLKTHANSAEALSNLAIVMSRRGQYPEAVKLYQQALKVNPALFPIHFNLAVTLIRLKDPSAITHLRAFLKAQPDEPRAHQLLGLCLVEVGDNLGAIEELESAYRANPNDPSILSSLAYAHSRAGDENRALELLAKTDAQPEQSALLRGLIEYRRERYDEAKVLLREVVDRNPNNAAAVSALGRLHLLQREDDEAIALLSKAIQLNPSDAESTYQLGVLHDRNGRSAEGISFLQRALTLRANYPDPHYQLGRIALNRKDYPVALKELETARRLLPNQEAIRLLLGRTYQALGREAEAKLEFAEVRRLKAEVIERSRQRLESDALMKQP